MLVRDFETGDLSGFKKTGSANWPEVTDQVSRIGKYSMKTYLHRDNSESKYRTSVIPLLDNGSRLDFPHHEEFFMGISIFIPTNFEIDEEGRSDILFQVHSVPDDFDNIPEECKRPKVVIAVDGDHWYIRARRISKQSKEWTAPLELGKWVDWVVQVTMSPDSDGHIKIWKDGEMVGEARGANDCDFKKPPFLLFGLYKWSWRPRHEGKYDTHVVERTFYHDEFRVGKTFEEVQPIGGGTVPDPDPPPIGEIMPVLEDLQAVEVSLRQLAVDATAQADAVAQAIVDLEAVDDALDAAADVIDDD